MTALDDELKAIIIAGTFSSMSQTWNPDKTCEVAVIAKDKSKYAAHVSDLYTAKMAITGTAKSVPVAKSWNVS